MNIKKTILTNTVYQLISKFLSTFSTLFLSTLIIRFLGVYTWGEYSIVLAYVTFFYIFCEFGLNTIATREFSKKQIILRSEFVNFFLVRVLNTIIVICLAFLGLVVLDFSSKITNAILISFIGVFAFSIGSSFNAVFQSKLKYKYLFYSTFVSSFINVFGFIYLFGYIKLNFYFLFYILIFSDFTKMLVSAFFANKLIKYNKIKIDINLLKFYFLSALPIGIALVFNTLMIQVDKIVLAKMRSSLEVGYYALAYKIFDVVLVLPTFFMNSAFSILVKKNNDSGVYSNEYSKSYYFLFLSSLLITFLIFVIFPIIIPIIWGREMFPSVFSLMILGIGTVFFYLSSPVSWTFVVENKQKMLVYVYFIGFIFNLVLNFFAIYYYGFLGASVVTIITEVYVLITLEYLRKKYLKVRLISPFNLKWISK